MAGPDPMSGSRDFLAGAGEMATLMRAYDWTTTPLGEPEGWPSGLRTAVRLLLNSHHPMHIFWGPEATFFYNDAFVPSAGPERHPSVLGRPASETWGEIWPVIASEVAKVRNGGGHTWYEDRHVPIMRHGRLEDAYWTYGFSPIDDDTAPGGIGGVISILTETTKRKALEDSLRASDRRHRDLLRQMPGFVAVLTGPTHVYEYVNDAYVTIAGQRSFLGHSVREVFPDLVGQGFFELLDGVYATGEPFLARGIPIRLGGEDEDRFIDLLYHPIRNDDGVVTGIFVGGYDVTVQNRATVALHELNETLEQRVAERSAVLSETEERLRQSQKMEAIGQLTGGVAHDFNNLLTIIRSSVDFLRRPELPEARKVRYLDAVSETVDRAAKLTGQLLAFARRQSLKPEIFDVGSKLRGIADMLDTVTGARVHVTVDVPDEPCFARADLSQFETALVNMAVNARDAMDGEGRLALRLACGKEMPQIRGHAASPAAFVVLSVTDTGSGIAPEQLARIFEPFFTTKEVGKGTGLGLSQVFGFAKQSGGDVNVSSVLGEGTTFTLYLPEETRAPASTAGGDADVLGSPVGAGQRVLVVEDNIEVGRFCTQILQDLGYVTEWAANAEEALDRLGVDGGGFDVVFSDVVMPGMGGVALAETLRERLPALPVVLASGYSHVLARRDDHGFELLHKPYSAEQLARILQRVVVKPSAARVHLQAR
ncbi:hybrid sensor histidine kinase/response regulator [Methylobacterium radiotolerans]|nr:PAS domain-containing sensor histidine kinase [Methylobacterium radiotolerans]GEM98338.1 hypothetical protein MRA01_28780 [Methylobacterium radiotolerans]